MPLSPPARTAFHLRSGHAEDVPKLAALSAAARARYGDWPELSFVQDAPPLGAERFTAADAIVACNDGMEPLGFALVRPLDGLLYLDNISVAPDAGGRGIGAALLRAVEARRARLALPAISLTTFRAPPWNGPWFRRHGFVPMPPHAIGKGLAEVVARQNRTLDPSSREVLWR